MHFIGKYLQMLVVFKQIIKLLKLSQDNRFIIYILLYIYNMTVPFTDSTLKKNTFGKGFIHVYIGFASCPVYLIKYLLSVKRVY